MEKVTITRVGQVKMMNTKFGEKPKTGVQFKEYGDLWHDIWRGDLKVGQELEGTRSSREYQGKTYWDFKLPNKDEAARSELSKVQFSMGAIKSRLALIEEKLGIKTVEDYKNLNHEPSENIEYPDEQINAEDIPF